jgi:Methyltransferase domain
VPPDAPLEKSKTVGRSNKQGSLLSADVFLSGAVIVDSECEGTRIAVAIVVPTVTRYALGVARRGYHVCAVDRSPELIAVAKNRALHTPAQLARSPTRLPSRLRDSLDAILSRSVLNDFVKSRTASASSRNLARVWAGPIRSDVVLRFRCSAGGSSILHAQPAHKSPTGHGHQKSSVSDKLNLSLR